MLPIGLVLLRILLLLSFMWISCFLITMIHELGHCLMYRIFFRDNRWHIYVGMGKTLIKQKRFTIRSIPIFGLFFPEGRKQGSKFQCIMLYLGGPIATVCFIIALSLLLYFIKSNQLDDTVINWDSLLTSMIQANFLIFIFTIIPMKYPFFPFKGNEISDGMRILMTLRPTKGEKSNG